MAEGDAVKSNGDVYYASEANTARGYGDGSDGAYSDSGNLVQNTVYEYTTFSLTNGNTLTTSSTSGEPIIIYVQGDCTIGGTIDLDDKGYDGGIKDAHGENFQRDSTYGTAATYETSNISKGLQALDNYEIFNAAFNTEHIDSGQGGSGGQSGTGGGHGGVGGNGGGSIIFIVGGNFNFQATGVITSDGENGTAGANHGTNQGGGGGGGGGAGCLWVLCRGTITNSGTITTTAGTGGAGGTGASASGGGKSGGGGASFVTDGSNGSAPAGNDGETGGAGAAGTNKLQQTVRPMQIGAV